MTKRLAVGSPLAWYRQPVLRNDPKFQGLKRPVEKLTVLLLRDLAASFENRLPDDPALLARAIQVAKRDVEAVLTDWFPIDPTTGLRFDPLIAEDQARLAARSQKAAQSGRIGAQKRHQTGASPTPIEASLTGIDSLSKPHLPPIDQ